jgi:hypothetical protein
MSFFNDFSQVKWSQTEAHNLPLHTFKFRSAWSNFISMIPLFVAGSLFSKVLVIMNQSTWWHKLSFHCLENHTSEIATLDVCVLTQWASSWAHVWILKFTAKKSGGSIVRFLFIVWQSYMKHVSLVFKALQIGYKLMLLKLVPFSSWLEHWILLLMFCVRMNYKWLKILFVRYV